MKYNKLMVYEIKNNEYFLKYSISNGYMNFQKNSLYLVLTATPYANKGFVKLDDRLKYFLENIYIYFVKNKLKSIDKIGVIIECHADFNIFNLKRDNYTIKENNLFSDFQNNKYKKITKILYLLLIPMIIVGFTILYYTSYTFKESSNSDFNFVFIKFIIGICFFISLLTTISFKNFIPEQEYNKLIYEKNEEVIRAKSE